MLYSWETGIPYYMYIYIRGIPYYTWYSVLYIRGIPYYTWYFIRKNLGERADILLQRYFIVIDSCVKKHVLCNILWYTRDARRICEGYAHVTYARDNCVKAATDYNVYLPRV
jgi:hypothetical protein